MLPYLWHWVNHAPGWSVVSNSLSTTGPRKDFVDLLGWSAFLKLDNCPLAGFQITMMFRNTNHIAWSDNPPDDYINPPFGVMPGFQLLYPRFNLLHDVAPQDNPETLPADHEPRAIVS